MTTQEALSKFLIENKVAKPGTRFEDLYVDNWFYTTVFGRSVPIFPSYGFVKGLAAHDTHHMINGYGTHWVGECETAAWELASGGCGRYVAYWLDRIFFVLIAAVFAPIKTLHAWRRGWGQRNLYRVPRSKLLAMELDEVLAYVSNRPIDLPMSITTGDEQC